MAIETDYYELLEVERGADDKTIKSAFRRLAMQYHPDRNPGDDECVSEDGLENIAQIAEIGLRARIGRIADMPGPGARRIDFKIEPRFFGRLAERTFRQR